MRASARARRSRWLALAALALTTAPALAGPPDESADVSDVEPELAQWNKSIVAQITVKKPGHAVISAAAADELRAAGMRVLKLARIVPANTNGKPSGFMVFGIRSKSIPSVLGLRNGDRLDEINGMPVRDIGELMAAYKKLAAAKRFRVRVYRRGKPRVLRIDVK